MSLLDLQGVDKIVRQPTGEPLQILHGVDLRIEQGEHVAIIGRSGSGKSTLLNILGLLDSPTGGTYQLEGHPVEGLSGRQRSDLRGRTFGFVFQQFNLLPRRSAVDNAAVPLLYAGGERFWRRRRIAAEVLTLVGLADRLDATPERLSGGEQQRVAIARAMVREPRIILADEPTGSLDVDTGQEVMNLLEQVCRERGATLITITHDLAVAARAQRRFRLEHGVVYTGADPGQDQPPADGRETAVLAGVTVPLVPLTKDRTEPIPAVPTTPAPRADSDPAQLAESDSATRTGPDPATQASPAPAPRVEQPDEDDTRELPVVSLTPQHLRVRRPIRVRRNDSQALVSDDESPGRPPLDEELYRMGGQE